MWNSANLTKNADRDLHLFLKKKIILPPDGKNLLTGFLIGGKLV